MESLTKVLGGYKKAVAYKKKNKKELQDEAWREIWADDAIAIDDQKIVEKIIKVRTYLWW